MASSSIRINGNTTPVETVKIGDLVSLSNFDNTGATTWVWVLTARPNGSSAAISAPSTATPTFTADKEGSYLLKLTVNGSLISTAVARVLAAHTGAQLLARDEIEEGDSTGVEGWARPSRDTLQLLDKRLGLTTRKTVKYTGANTTGPMLLKVNGSATLSNGDAIPSVVLAVSGSGYAGLVFFDKTVVLNTNDVISVVTNGLTDLILNPDTLVAEDRIFTSPTPGVLTKTQTSTASIVGCCTLVSGGNVRLWFQPGMTLGIAPLGSVPNTSGASITGNVLTLQPADATNPGSVTTVAQTFTGVKTADSWAVPDGGKLILTTDARTYFDYISGTVRLRLNSTNYLTVALATGDLSLASAGAFNSTRASGNNAFNMLDGARFNFSTADVNAYLYRSAADTISAAGTLGASKFVASVAAGVPFSSSASDGQYVLRNGANWGIWVNSGGATMNFDVAGTTAWTVTTTKLLAAVRLDSSIASGSDAMKISDGARFNFSTADVSAYLARTAANVIETPGSVKAGSYVTSGTSGTSIDLSANVGGSGSTILLAPGAGINFGNGDSFAYLLRSATNTLRVGDGISSALIAGAFSSSKASGFAAYSMLDGARLNFSTGDANAYLYRSTTDTIRTPSKLIVDQTLTVSGVNGIILNSNSSPQIFFNSPARAAIASAASDAVTSSSVEAMQFSLTQALTAGDLCFAFRDSLNAIYLALSQGGRVSVNGTDGSATIGPQTINKACGKATIANASSSVVITNSLVTSVSVVSITWEGDHGAARSWVVPAAGQFTVTLSGNSSAATTFNFNVLEPI